MIKFIVTVASCYFIAYYAALRIIQRLFKQLEISASENLALAVGMFFYTVLCYILQRFWVFKKKQE